MLLLFPLTKHRIIPTNNKKITMLMPNGFNKNLFFAQLVNLEEMLDKKSNPYLISEEITGTDGGITSGLGFKFTLDSRDNIFYPSKGGYYQLSAVYYQKIYGSDFIFNNYIIDLRRYLSATEDHIFAFQVYSNFVGGNTPFFKLPALGGSSLMRGYYEGRYRDKYYFTTQAEYRTELFKRIGLVGFAGVGEVAGSISDYKLSGLKYSFGIGVEKVFPLHSPLITSIRVLKKGKVRRAKLYYMRQRYGKKARIKELRGY